MNIRRAESAKDLKDLIDFKDDVETYLDCKDRMQWVQWLIQQVGSGNKRIGVWMVRDDDGHLMGYVAAMDGVVPPVFWGVTIIYVYSPVEAMVNKQLMDTIEDWAREVGAKDINFNTRMPRLFKRYGFVEQEEFVWVKKEL